MRLLLVGALALALAAAAVTPSQGRAALSASDSTLLSSIRAASGPGRIPLNRAVLIWVPAGVSIIGPADTRKLIEGLHIFNLDDDILATAIFEAADETWFAFFRYVDGGHVPDSGVLNPDSILTTIKIKNHDDNEERLSRGGRRLQIDGWQEAPRYDPTTHSLTWTVHATTQEGAVAIHSARLLGRNGHVHVRLRCGADYYQAVYPELMKIIRGVSFTEGHGYADFHKGDRIASYSMSSIEAGEDAWNAAKGKRNDYTMRLIVGLISALAVSFGGKHAVRRHRARKAARKSDSAVQPDEASAS